MNEDEIGLDVVVEEEEEAVEIKSDVLKGDKGDKGDPGNDGYSPTITTDKTGKTTTITITDIEGTQTATINDGEDGAGSGDMLKSVYDTDDNGIVDNAEKVNNHTVNKDVPSDAVFTDTVYDDTALAGRVSALESGKQDNLTAGTNISISNNTISTSAEPNTLETVKVNGVTQTITNKAIDINESKIADKYSSSATYSVGDYCIYNNTLYICNTAISTAEAFDSTKWTEISVTSQLKSNASQISGLDNRVMAMEEKNLILAEMSSNWSLTNNNEYLTIPFGTAVKNIGSAFSLNNGVITIGSGVTLIKVIVRLGIVKATAGLIYSRILHTHNGSPSSNYTANQQCGANQRGGINTEYLYSVAEGDTIQIQTYGSTADVVTGGSGISYCMIEAINDVSSNVGASLDSINGEVI